jgi:hypothetical protein
MTQVSTFRLYLLRGLFLLIGLAMGSMIWPGIIHHTTPWTHMQGVANAMLGALTALSLLGVRYPLQMLPLMLFELLWKTIWVAAVGLPLYFAHQLTGANADSMREILPGLVLCPIAIPWRYVFENYVKRRGDRWTGSAEVATGA